MIAPFASSREARLLREDVAALKSIVATLSAQVTLLSTQAAAELERSVAMQGERDRLERSVAELREVVASQVDGLTMQAMALSALERDRNERAESLLQLRGDLVRLQRQTSIDLKGLRETDMAIAKATLIERLPGFGCGTNGDERMAVPSAS